MLSPFFIFIAFQRQPVYFLLLQVLLGIRIYCIEILSLTQSKSNHVVDILPNIMFLLNVLLEVFILLLTVVLLDFADEANIRNIIVCVELNLSEFSESIEYNTEKNMFQYDIPNSEEGKIIKPAVEYKLYCFVLEGNIL